MGTNRKMTKRTRFFAILAALAVTACVVCAQGQPQAPAQGAQQPEAQQPGRGRGNGGRSGDGFSQFIRPLASQDVLLRGESLYNGNCASCHAADLRGTLNKTPNLLRSGIAMEDQHGELIGPALAKHDPPLNLVNADAVAVSEYIHSVLATMGPQGSPPGRNPVGLKLNVLVGDPEAGKAYFDAHCSNCHSVNGDMKGIGAKYTDPRALQDAWVRGAAASGNPFAGRGGDAGRAVTVTLPNGQKIEGKLVSLDDFNVNMTLTDGTPRTIPIENNAKVEVADPLAAHKQMLIELDDPQNKNMHDVTAYLATLK